MSTPEEKFDAIVFSISIAERRLKELKDKPVLTREEEFEKVMTERCIERGNALLQETARL